MAGDDPAPGREVLAQAVSAYRQALGPRLVAAFALGSLAHGGFSALVSDVDLGLVLSDPLEPSDAETVRAVAEAVKAGGSALHDRLSVFWGTPSTLRGEQAGGRFPPLDRLDLIEHGLLLEGDDVRGDLPRPSGDELLVVGAEFALTFLAGMPPTEDPAGYATGSLRPGELDAVEPLRRPEVALAHGIRHVTKLVLFPVRFLYTAETGRVGTNHAAVERYLGADPPPPATGLVAAALAWRSAPPAGDAEAEALLRAEMVPLYLHYIDDHIPRLAGLGRTDLAAGFREWRRRILA